MKIIKNHIVFILIILLGLFLRLINLDKSGGLWYDEMTIYSIASKSFPNGMINTDAHRFLLFPLYYMVYHVWILIFGNADVIIRLMSVFFDILSIICAFFAGKSFAEAAGKSEKFGRNTGTIYALLYALNSSFIYYAQEAKFYSMTFFLANLLIICWTKFLQKKDNKTFIYFFIANFLLIYTYTSQIILTFIIALVSILYFIKEEKPKNSNFYILITPLMYLPLIIICAIIPKYFSGNFDSVVYDNTFILMALQNYFSPVLAGVQNNILQFHRIWISGLLNFKFWLFTAFPIIFILSAIAISIKNFKLSRYIVLVPVIYIFMHIAASNTTEYSLLVRYTLSILPFLLLVSSAAIANIDNLKLKNTLLIAYSIICLLGIISINGAVNIPRPDGYKELAVALTQNNIPEESDFVLPIRPDLLDKYYLIKGRKLSLYTLNSMEAQRTYLTSEEINGIKNDKQNLHKYYKRYFLTDYTDKKFEAYIKKNFINKNDIIILTDKSICMFTNEQIKMLALSENYEKYPLQFLRLSKLNNDLLKTTAKTLTLKQHIIIKNWEIFVFGI